MKFLFVLFLGIALGHGCADVDTQKIQENYETLLYACAEPL